MFRVQIEQLKETEMSMEKGIAMLEDSIKKQKAELRDVKQAIASLERIQTKYDIEELDEAVSVSV